MTSTQLSWDTVKGMMEDASASPNLDSVRSVAAGELQSMNTNAFGKMDSALGYLETVARVEAMLPSVQSQLRTVFSSLDESTIPSGFNQETTIDSISSSITDKVRTNSIANAQSQIKASAATEMQRVGITKTAISNGSLSSASSSPQLCGLSAGSIISGLNSNFESGLSYNAGILGTPVKDMCISQALSTLKSQGFSGDQVNIIGSNLTSYLPNDSALSSENLTAAISGKEVAAQIEAAKNKTSNWYS